VPLFAARSLYFPHVNDAFYKLDQEPPFLSHEIKEHVEHSKAD
jgi:hypothetical protein